MPQFSSAVALKMVQERGLDVPFIIVSGTIGEEAAVAAMKAGAQDYLIKGNLKRFVPAMERELRDAVRRREQRKLEVAMLAQQEQLRIAREIQQGLFPTAQVDVENFDIAGVSFPTEATGGDYFDYIPMPEDHLGIVIGDITGHGLGASLLMAEMRACLRTLALNCTDVSEILARANRLTKDDFGGERFLTVLFARLSPRTRSLVYLNAGHPSGYILARDGSVRAELKSAGMPLGLHPLSEFPPACSIALEAGDLVLFLTDGVLDAFAHGDGDSGTSRALELVRAHRDEPASQIVEALCRAARDAVPRTSQHDDITALVLKVRS
jgi:sigma-B regulation protein RsbU (phosphoserine phosphatase)